MTTDQKIDKILQKVGGLETGQNELTKKVDNLEGKVESLQSSVAQLKKGQQSLEIGQNSLEGKITRIEKTQERIVVAVANLQVSATETNERLGDLETGQNILLNQVDHFVTKIDHHETEIIANHAHYMRLEKQMNA